MKLKKILIMATIILIICFGTIAQLDAEEAYNLNGEWKAFYNYDPVLTHKDGIKIIQQGNNFVGTIINGYEFVPKGSETIKGVLNKNEFKSLFIKGDIITGWIPATGEIDDKNNKVIMTTGPNTHGVTTSIVLTK